MRGFSQARLDRMHASMRRHVESGYPPGLVTLVRLGDREHVDAIGTMVFDGFPSFAPPLNRR